MTDSASIVTDELDAIIASRRQHLSLIEQEMAETQRELTALVGRREQVKLTLDALTEFREKVAPTPTPVAVAREAAPVAQADPLSVKCPACGSWPGQGCLSLDWGDYHAARHAIAAEKAAEAAAVDPRPFFEQVADVQALLNIANAKTDGEPSDPKAHACPECNAQPGEDCRGLDWGLFHARRPGTARIVKADRG